MTEQHPSDIDPEWAHRLATIGRALRGVLHEVKTPLGTISLTAEYIGEKIKRQENVEEEISIIRQEAERAGEILRNFLEFTRPSKLSLADVDLSATLTKSIQVMKPRFDDAGISLDVKLLEGQTVQASERHLIQVFTNIFMNAIKAMPMGGKLVVRQSTDEEYLRTTFLDTGTGISSEDLKTIFEPYGQRQHAREGYGLGLSISRWIMHQHDGTFRVTSPGLGKGTAVSLELPLPSAP
jgi:signal transduction histidine kinase